jgi:hypothetical protein
MPNYKTVPENDSEKKNPKKTGIQILGIVRDESMGPSTPVKIAGEQSRAA